MCQVRVSLTFVIVICLLGAALSKQCRKLDPAISKLCGYNYTVEFQHESQFNSSLRGLRHIISIVGNCSEHHNLITCSLYLPRCEEDIPGPYLPCKRVCDEYVKSCGETIIGKGLEWTVAMCQLLPQSDDPQTNKGYMGRCFEPLNFNATAGDAKFNCSRVVEPLCQGLGYKETVVSEKNQQKYAKGLEFHIGNHTSDKKCGEVRRQIVCAEFLPACKNNKVQFLCRSNCYKFFNTCKSPFFYGKEMCIEFPKGNSLSGLCHQTHWPRYDNWPAPPTTLPSTTGTSVTMTTREIGTEQTESPPVVAARSNSMKPTLITSIAVPLAVVITVALILLGFLIYRKRRPGQFRYEKQLVYTANQNEDFE